MLLSKLYQEKLDPNKFVIESYKEFLLGTRPTIDNDDGDIVIHDGGLVRVLNALGTLTMQGQQVRLLHPSLSLNQPPAVARERKTTYAVTLKCRVEIDGELERHKSWICNIPLMVGVFDNAHPVDPYDSPGYFIVRGSEYAIINIERHVNGKPLLRIRKEVSTKKVFYECYVPNFVSFFLVSKKADGHFEVSIASHCKDAFSMREMMYILGCRDPSEQTRLMREYGITEEEEEDFDDARIHEKVKISCRMETPEETLTMLSQHWALGFIPEYIDFSAKLPFFLTCAQRVCKLESGEVEPTKLNAIQNKQFMTVGFLMGILIENEIAKIRRTWEKSSTLVYKTFKTKQKTLTEKLEQAFTGTSDWPRGIPNPKRDVKRISSHLQLQCLLRNLFLKIHEDNRQTSLRLWDGTCYGFVCPITTPEGENIGKLKSLAILAEISGWVDPEIVYRMFIDKVSTGPHRLWFNFVQIGTADDDFFQWVRINVKHQQLPHLSVYKNAFGIHINCLPNRPVRPLENLSISRYYKIGNKPWRELEYLGVVEWVDVEEQAGIVVCPRTQKPQAHHTHREIHDGAIHSIEANRTQLLNHDKPARNQIAQGMCKQAVGCHAIQERWDQEPHYTLCYPQKELSPTDMGLFCLSDKLPSSQNVVVGVYTHPNNQDDAIVMNRRLIDFGGYLITCDQSFSFKLPIKTQWKKGERPREIPQREWEKLGDNGIIRKGSRVFFDSPLACICDMDGKVVMVCKLHVVLNDHGVEDTDYQYFVRSVLETYDRCNNPMLLVKVTHLRKPQIGDKFASRSAQKGVVGEIRSPEDMIFTMRDGITPDIVINPHCMPSRQTLGQLITMVTDKSKALTCHWGQYNNLTPFNNQLDLDRIFSELGEHGEKELCIHPWTGEMIPEPVNIGIAPYQRLVHFSADKLSAVLDGDKNPETGAPLKGKKRMGGVRVGEMEQNVLAAHGVAEFQHEKMMKLSDGVEVAICSNCGEAMKAGTTTCIYSCTQGTVENRIVRNSTLRFKSVLNAGQITFSQT